MAPNDVISQPASWHSGLQVAASRYASVVSIARPESVHHLEKDAIKLRDGIVLGLATSAPGQSTAITMAAVVAATSYATGPAILIGMLPMLAIALCYQRLNHWKQNCGGPYVWVKESISPYLGFFIAWSMLVAFVLAIVSNILPFAPAFLSLFGISSPSAWAAIVVTTVLGLSLTGIAAVGLKVTARFQWSMAAIEYGVLLVFSLIGFWAVFIRRWPGTVHPTAAWLHLSGVGGKGSLAAGLLIAVYLFTGWDAPMYVNEETTERRRNPGRAVVWSVVILAPIFVWLIVSLQGGVSATQLANNSTNALPFIAAHLTNSFGGKVMAFAVILSIVGTTEASLVAVSRVTYSMGTDRLLPSAFAKVHPNYGTPTYSAVIWGLVMVIVTDLCIGIATLANAFSAIVNAEALAFIVFYSATALATIVFYRRLATKTIKDLFLVLLIPLGGIAMLVWIFVKSIPGLSSTGKWCVLGAGILGLVLMAIYAAAGSPFFAPAPEVSANTSDS